jgi:hypothetical protein
MRCGFTLGRPPPDHANLAELDALDLEALDVAVLLKIQVRETGPPQGIQGLVLQRHRGTRRTIAAIPSSFGEPFWNG